MSIQEELPEFEFPLWDSPSGFELVLIPVTLRRHRLSLATFAIAPSLRKSPLAHLSDLSWSRSENYSTRRLSWISSRNTACLRAGLEEPDGPLVDQNVYK
ncbi:hypothetical protein HRR83_006584 [Exophiala dermatitidis]|uniref:Uncharacterized protein n=1 Tax=Exophiala dermatitidis TaxID=5970 RepID=A0AAN6ET78_EXODE|nr:hypothetical protein HRR74_005744 [Exophiala dermatitidis]KAJ4515431.1 hypothetical protein HRR73_005263 [Exophiala dermatitidis]KAJ4533735.1 hypothetical protein HRR77_008219 [Exophiala dermatitidis]KAJ4540958.1 hypothetical protein HRR76_004342 [Exophiala dermatitidis]KAJ4560590.1 hypothetical protein HRR79_007999 [Exophiala dermatitidis]